MIIAQETFYGAEGVGSVIVSRPFYRTLYCSPQNRKWSSICLAGTSNLITYSSTTTVCLPKWSRMTLSSRTLDLQLTCSTSNQSTPKQTPFIRSTAILLCTLNSSLKTMYFNSSIAEQTNVWLGGYYAICQEMLVDKYTFFLDEIILCRNQMMREKLAKEGKSPENWPIDNTIQ